MEKTAAPSCYVESCDWLLQCRPAEKFVAVFLIVFTFAFTIAIASAINAAAVTRGFQHSSIPDAVAAIEELAESAGIETEHAGDSDGVFTDENLANFDAVVWASTTGDVLNNTEQGAFERFIGAGNGYVGIHAASDTEFDWPWYGELVGAYFDRHPSIQQASQAVENSTHISTAHLPAIWTRTDEWYDYQTNPRSNVNVLLTLDEDSYDGGEMGDDHPSAWFHEFSGGRSWYTGCLLYTSPSPRD